MLAEKAHDNGATTYRNLRVDGHNLETTRGKVNGQVVDHAYLAPYVAEQFKVLQGISHAAKHGKKKSVEAFHLIVSFDEKEFPLSGDQQQEAKQAAQLVHGFMDRQFPEDSQWLMAIQRDGKGHKLHAHVAINSVQTDGKVIDRSYTHQKDWTYTKSGKVIHEKGIASNLDDYLTENFEKVTGRPFTPVVPSKVNRVHSAEEQIVRRGGYDWHQDLKDRIRKAVDNPNVHDLTTFEAACADLGVTVIHKRRGTGRKDAKGHKIYRTGYTYEFTGKDTYKSGNSKGQFKTHKMRDYRLDRDGHLAKGTLGAAFTPEYILKEIQNNEYIKKQSDATAEHAGIHQDVQTEAHDGSANKAAVEASESSISTGNQTGDNEDEPRIEPTSATNESSKPAVEPDSSYSSSRKQRTFTAPRHLRKVDWSVFDPDADSRERTRRKQQERDKRLNEFKRRAEAIAEHNREVARRANHIKSRNPYGPNRFHGVWGRLWNSIFFTDLVDEIKQIFGFNAQSGRFDQKYAQPRPTTTNHRKRSQIDKSEHVEGDGPDLF